MAFETIHGAFAAFGDIRIVCARYHFAWCIFTIVFMLALTRTIDVV